MSMLETKNLPRQVFLWLDIVKIGITRSLNQHKNLT